MQNAFTEHRRIKYKEDQDQRRSKKRKAVGVGRPTVSLSSFLSLSLSLDKNSTTHHRYALVSCINYSSAHSRHTHFQPSRINPEEKDYQRMVLATAHAGVAVGTRSTR